MAKKKSDQRFLKSQMWDTFARISQRTGTSEKKLIKYNPDIKQGFMQYGKKVRYK